MNPFYEDKAIERITAAATALATLVKDSGKPLRLDLDLYMQFVVPTKVGHLTEEQWDELHDTKIKTVQDLQAMLNRVKAFKTQWRESSNRRRLFAETLADALTFDEVAEIQPCLLVEEGLTDLPADDGTTGSINSWFVIPVPTDFISVI